MLSNLHLRRSAHPSASTHLISLSAYAHIGHELHRCGMKGRLITTFEIITSLSVDVITEPLKAMLNEKLKQNDGKS